MDILRDKLLALIRDMVSLLQTHQTVSRQFFYLDHSLTDLKQQVQQYHNSQRQDRRNLLRGRPVGCSNLCTYLLESNICNGFRRNCEDDCIISDAGTPIASAHELDWVPDFDIKNECVIFDNNTKMKELKIENRHKNTNSVHFFEENVKRGSLMSISDVDHYKLITRINQLAVNARLGSGSPNPRRKLHRQCRIDEILSNSDVYTQEGVEQGEKDAPKYTKYSIRVQENDEHSDVVVESTNENENHPIDENNDTESDGAIDTKENGVTIINETEEYTSDTAGSSAYASVSEIDNKSEVAGGNIHNDYEAIHIQHDNGDACEPHNQYNASDIDDILNIDTKSDITIISDGDVHSIAVEDELSDYEEEDSETDSIDNESASFLDIQGGYVRCRIKSPLHDGQYESSFFNLDSEPEYINIQEGRVVCMIKQLKRDHSSWMDCDTDSDSEYKIDRLFHRRKFDRFTELDSDTESDTVSGSTSTKASEFGDYQSDITEGSEDNKMAYIDPDQTDGTRIPVEETTINSDTEEDDLLDNTINAIDIVNCEHIYQTTTTAIDENVTSHELEYSCFNYTGKCISEGSSSQEFNTGSLTYSSNPVTGIPGILGGPASRFTSLDSGFGDDEIGDTTI